ncbi:MAG TPA: hypothetical protein VFU63_08670 [Ktedonobacterales bacterium]|nr:hypothetical protein [Ktedonobacterales bacterium]
MLIITLQGLLALLSIAVTAFSLVEPLSHSSSMSVWEILLRIAGAVALVAILVGLIILIVRVFTFLLGRPFGVTATDQGIDARTELGTHIHMDWDEVRLLEAVGADANAARRFYLYALGKRISWAEYRVRFGADYVPADISSSEMTLRQNALLNLVVVRTGLPLRTLAKTLQKRPASSGELRRSTSVSIQLVCALILLGILAVDYLIPISPIPWLKWVSTGALALAALCTISLAVRTAFARSASLTHSMPLSAGAPSLDAPGLVYTLRWRPSLGRRVALIALGLSFAISLVPAVLLLLLALLALGVALPGYQPQILHGDGGDFTVMGRFGLAMVHGLVGIVGVGLVYGGAIAARVRIRANQDGLAIIAGPHERVMAWSSVQEISWGTGRYGQSAYLVKGNDPTLQISWPAGPHVTSASLPGDGTVPIGADELAALVAARISKPIRVRNGE